jgi:hypothetical protein
LIPLLVLLSPIPTAQAKLLDKACSMEGKIATTGGQVLLCKTRGESLLWSKTNWRKLTLVSDTTITIKRIPSGGPISMKQLGDDCRAHVAKRLSVMNNLPINVRTSLSKKKYEVPLEFLGVRTSSPVYAFGQTKKADKSARIICRWRSSLTLVELKSNDVLNVRLGTLTMKKSFNELSNMKWILKLKI